MTPTKEPTAEQKAAQAKLDARVNELKALKGKTFRLKVGTDKQRAQIVTVEGYAGIAVIAGGLRAHTLQVEARNPGSRWSPPATKFLEDYEPVEVKPETKQEGII